MTWHQWHQVAVKVNNNGFPSRRAAVKALSFHSRHAIDAWPLSWSDNCGTFLPGEPVGYRSN